MGWDWGRDSDGLVGTIETMFSPDGVAGVSDDHSGVWLLFKIDEYDNTSKTMNQRNSTSDRYISCPCKRVPCYQSLTSSSFYTPDEPSQSIHSSI